MARPQVANGGTASIWRIAANMLNKQFRKADKGWSYSLVFGVVITDPHPKQVWLRKVRGLDSYFGMTKAMEKGS